MKLSVPRFRVQGVLFWVSGLGYVSGLGPAISYLQDQTNELNNAFMPDLACKVHMIGYRARSVLKVWPRRYADAWAWGTRTYVAYHFADLWSRSKTQNIH